MADARQVIVFPRGQLSTADKDRLNEAGIVAVEADDPSKVVTCIPGTPLIGVDDLLMSAMHGISGSGSYQERSNMVLELHRRMKARESGKDASR